MTISGFYTKNGKVRPIIRSRVSSRIESRPIHTRKHSSVHENEEDIESWFAAHSVPGQASFHTGYSPKYGHMVVFMVREESPIIARVNPRQAIRFGLSKVKLNSGKEVGVVPIILQIPNDITGAQFYEVYLNYQADNGHEALDYLINGQYFTVIFYGDSGNRERGILHKIQDNDKEVHKRMKEYLDTMEPWTMGEFDQAKAKIYESHPTIQRLWDSIGGYTR